MKYLTGVVAVMAAASASAGAAAADPGQPSGAEVFNYGQCVSAGFPAPASGEFGPLVLVFNSHGVVFNIPPGQASGPAANPLGEIACPVVAGP